MRLMILILALIWSIAAWAEFICVNPTTQFYLQKERVGHKLILNSPYGAKFTPVYDGQVPPFALNQIKADAEAIQKLGDRIQVSFEEGDCWNEGSILSCQGGVMLDFKAENVRLYSVVVSEKSFNYDYTFLKLILVFNLDGHQYKMSSRYDPKTCSIY